jgi:hypothetical protein
MAPILEAAAKNRSVSFLLYTPCPAAFGGSVRREVTGNPLYVQRCADQRKRGIDLLNRDPSINLVILSASWAYLPATAIGDETLEPMSGISLLKRGITDFLDAAARPGRNFRIISSVPQNAVDPVPCAVNNQLGLLRSRCPPGYGRTKETTLEKVQPIDDMIKEIADARKDVTVVLPSQHLCTGAECILYLDGQFLYRDMSHLRRNLLEKTRRDLAALIGLTAAFDDLPTGVAASD